MAPWNVLASIIYALGFARMNEAVFQLALVAGNM